MKRAFTLLEFIVVVAVVLFLAAVLFPVFSRSRDTHRPTCTSPLKQIGLGFMQYVQDYDEVFPPVRTVNSVGWADLILPYIKSAQVFQCPQGQNSTTPFSTDYFSNRRLSGFAFAKVKQPALTVLGGDGEDNAPPWNAWAQMPSDAATNSSSPAQRHLDGANYLFADSHVKWQTPDKISSTFAAPTSRPTFAVR